VRLDSFQLSFFFARTVYNIDINTILVARYNQVLLDNAYLREDVLYQYINEMIISSLKISQT
jgi:hypothetical protein